MFQTAYKPSPSEKGTHSVQNPNAKVSIILIIFNRINIRRSGSVMQASKQDVGGAIISTSSSVRSPFYACWSGRVRFDSWNTAAVLSLFDRSSFFLRTLARDPKLRFRGLRNDLLLVKVALVRIASFPDSEAEYRLLTAEIRREDACMTKWGGAR